MKKIKYILIILTIFLAIRGFGQGLCQPKGISTNPDNPVNADSPNMINDFFDWRVQDYEQYFSPNYSNQDPSFVYPNPYWSPDWYLDYLSGYGTDGSEIDYAPTEGWELLSRGFGRFMNGEINTNSRTPYFLMYNKYLSRIRLLFALPPTVIFDAFQSIEVEMAFVDLDGEGSDPIAFTGIFGKENGLAQPMDSFTDNTSIIGVANFVESGWSHAEFDVAYDPCTCITESAFELIFTGIQTSDVTMTGLFVGLNQPLNMFNASQTQYLDANRLLTVLENGENPEVGVETYKSIAKWTQASQGSGQFTLLPGIVKKLAGLLPFFDLAHKAGLFKLLDNIGNPTYYYEDGDEEDNYLNGSNLTDNEDGTFSFWDLNENWITVEGDDIDTLNVSFSESAKSYAKITKSTNTVLKKFFGKKRSFPSVIQGEMALSGTINLKSKIDVPSFTIYNPGTAPSDATVNMEFDNPRYPFYNEVLGRFALLKTPIVKWSSENISSIEEDPFDHEGFNELIHCKGSKVIQLDENSIEYVFNPAADIDVENTEILVALVISDPDGDEILENDVEIDGFPLTYPPIEHFQVGRKNWEKTYLDSDGHVKYFSPFLPLECLGNLVSETSTFIEYQTDNGYSGNVSFDYCDFVGEYGNVAPKVELRFIIKYAFTTNNRNGNPNQALQILTYPVEMQQVEMSEITNDLTDVAPGDLSLAGSISGNVAAFGTITITGPLVNTLGSPIDIVAQQIIVALGVIIPNGFNLIIGMPPQCGAPIGTSTIDLETYCTKGTYKANVLSMPAKTRLEEAKKLEERRKEFRLGSFPNPFSDQFVVEYNLEQDEDVSLFVRNELGEIVFSETFADDVKGQHYYTINSSDFPTGIYFLTIQTESDLKTVKLMKQTE